MIEENNQETDYHVPPQFEQERPQSFYQNHKRVLWSGLITLAVITASAVLVMLLFGGGGQVDYDDDVIFSVEGPSEAVSGSEISYNLKIKNKSSSVLSKVTLEFFYPRGFLPKDVESRAMEIKDLEKGEERGVVLNGTITGSVQEIKILSVKLRYTPVEFRSIFEKEAQSRTLVLAPDIELELSSPAQAISGQMVEYKVLLKNLTDEAFRQVRLLVKYPHDFTYENSSIPPADQQRGDEWFITDMDPAEEHELKIRGRLGAETGADSLVQAEVYLTDETHEWFLIARDFSFTEVEEVPLKISHDLKSTAKSVSVGDRLSYRVVYENTGKVGLRNVKIDVDFVGDTFDFSSLKAKTGQRVGNVLTWTPSVVSELLVVDPGEKGQFEFDIEVRKDLAADFEKNRMLRTTVKFSSDEFSDSFSGNSLATPVRTKAELQASAQKITDNIYRISLVIDNTLNDIKNAVMTATVPSAGASLDQGTVSPAGESGNIKFNQSSGFLKWDLGKIFAFSGSFHSSRTISFELTVPYGSSLLRGIELKGVDEFTGEDVKIEIGEVREGR